MSIIQAIILAIVEGLTEFLPISSTGHMIITSYLLGIEETPFVKMFTVAVQLGAILSVVVLYFKEFFRSFDIYLKLLVAFIPAAIAGLLLGKHIDAVFENPVGVAVALLLGGIVLLYVNKWFAKNELKDTSIKDISYKNAGIIGLFQVIALFPGVSRSASTIIGGLTQKLNRQTAAEFSFLLAVPTMFAATAYKMLKYQFPNGKEDIMLFIHGIPNPDPNVGFHSHDILLLAIGNIVAFIVALLAIKGFLGILHRFGFKLFGYYRIALGIILLLIFGIDKLMK
jgi:undecaprenyl-diphosphatase